MKKLAFLVLAVASCVASAQGIVNYMPDANTRTPQGASGPGVVYTQRTTGKIISVGAPIYQNVVIGQNCQTYQTQQTGSVINVGTFLGTVAGGIIGAQVGQGDGRLVATAIGAATGGAVGNHLNQANPQTQTQCVPITEQRLMGYSFIAQYEHLQMQGFTRSLPRIGQDVEIIINSTFYAGS